MKPYIFILFEASLFLEKIPMMVALIYAIYHAARFRRLQRFISKDSANDVEMNGGRAKTQEDPKLEDFDANLSIVLYSIFHSPLLSQALSDIFLP